MLLCRRLALLACRRDWIRATADECASSGSLLKRLPKREAESTLQLVVGGVVCAKVDDASRLLGLKGCSTVDGLGPAESAMVSSVKPLHMLSALLRNWRSADDDPPIVDALPGCSPAPITEASCSASDAVVSSFW